MQRPTNSKSDCCGVKHSETRDDKVRFNKIRQENEIKRGEIKKGRPRNATGETNVN
jgi:hypothetical protein